LEPGQIKNYLSNLKTL